MGLREYHRKRNFAVTPEPKGDEAPADGRSFVVQKHAASRLHYDFRLEMEGVLKSWAVPKGPCYDPSVKRLAMQTEDHPVDYGGFEGIIPEGEYGGGTVLLWDRGTWTPVGNPHEDLRRGALKFELNGAKLHGRWALVRIKSRGARDDNAWLLVKDRDEHARREAEYSVVDERPESVTSGRSLEEIAAQQDRVWHSNREAARKPVRAPVPRRRARTAVAPVREAKVAKLPAFVPPQLATLVEHAPAGDEWLHEIKFDGFRVLGRVEDGEARLLTRTGQDWTDRFPTVARALEALPAGSALYDGEVTVLLPDGKTSFQALQNQGEGDGRLVYYAFDLLHLDGRDLAPLPLERRKEALAGVLGRDGGVVRYADHVVGDGEAFFAQACKAGLEGIVSKRRGEPYRPGRSPSWTKTKCMQRQELVVGGFTEPEGSRAGLGALLVGHWRDGELVFAGKVGTGYTQKSARELRKRLDRLVQTQSPFAHPPRAAGRTVRWVKPELVAEVSFFEVTKDGKLRHPSFIGLRDDKPAADVRWEAPAADAPGPAPAASGVKLTHPERVLWPDVGVTKAELLRYYEAVAAHVLPHLRGRPLSLVRCPEGVAGECFYVKHVPRTSARSLRRVSISERARRGEYVIADDLKALGELVQMSALELHTWNSTAEHLEQPDRVVFDFDPGPKVRFAEVVRAARLVRERLEQIGVDGFLKSTGGKGLHVVVPLVPDAGWDECVTFSRLVAEAVVAQDRKRFTTAMPKEGREDKVLIDYFRNNRGATSVAAYSTRSRPGAPVSAPLTWDELAAFDPDAPWTVRTLPQRLASLRDDPWADYPRSGKRLADIVAGRARRRR